MFYFRFSFREIQSSYKLDPQTSRILHFRFTSGQWLSFLVLDSIICRRRRTRTTKVLTPLSRPCPAWLSDKGQLFSKIRTESGQLTESRQTESRQQTDTGHNFSEIRTKIRQGQDIDNAVRRRLITVAHQFMFSISPFLPEIHSNVQF